MATSPKTRVSVLGRSIVTLDHFILDRQIEFRYASGELSRILYDISLAAKVINREVNKAGLVDIMGITNATNVHGEEVKKLDVFAHREIIKSLRLGGQCCVLGSEEEEDIIPIRAEDSGEYIVLFDPLDGSSNIDVNVSIGTIFSIYRRQTAVDSVEGLRKEALQRGVNQVAAGYVLYGSSTMLVYTTGHGVNGFTLDPGIGEFLLSHPNIQIPAKGKYYSTNQGYYHLWEEGLKNYIRYLIEDDPATGRPYSLRYIGTLVADIHRTLLYGGVFFYPGTHSAPKGKLRLMYECNPMAFIIEQAGGTATDGFQRILDIKPERLHQRAPLFIGSKVDVEQVHHFLQKGR
ncbi:MAG: class 1 fructose-bisphosphatase [Acidobacteria bacterium]|nr:class 1 fructose-bisphosphatase [Acidobacteriota bacterium]